MTITTINSHPAASSTENGDNKNGQQTGLNATDLIFASLIQGVIQHKTGVLRYGEQLNLESRTAGNVDSVPPVRAGDDVSAGADSSSDNSQSADSGEFRDRPDDDRPTSGGTYENGTSTAPVAADEGNRAADAPVTSSAANDGETGVTNDTAEAAVAEQGNVHVSEVFARAAPVSANARVNTASGSAPGTSVTSATPGASAAQVVAGNQAPGDLLKPVVKNLATPAGNGNGQGNSQLPANTTLVSTAEPTVSQPAGNLSSNASLVAQSVSSAATDVSAEEVALLTESTAKSARAGTGSGQTGNQATSNGTNGGGQALPNAAANPVAGIASQTGQTAAALSSTQAAARMAANGQSTHLGGPNNISSGLGQSDFGAQVARATQAAPPPKAPVPPRAVATQIAVQIQKAVGQGTDNISIKLNPPELGRVDVKLEITSQGRVVAHIAAEKPETLEMLQRDARGLQQALEDAGLKTDTGSLSFNLRSDGSAFNRELADESAPGTDNTGDDEAADANGDAGDADAPPQEYASDKLINVEV